MQPAAAERSHRTEPIVFFIGWFCIAVFATTFACSASAAEKFDPIPKELPSSIAKETERLGFRLLGLEDCELLVQIYHPKDRDISQLGFCIYLKTITKGIYKATSCVGDLVEPESGVKNPFYGKNGHWGVEGPCDKNKLVEKFKNPEADKSVNPISAVRLKRDEGLSIRMLRDKLGLWSLFEERTQPGKKKK